MSFNERTFDLVTFDLWATLVLPADEVGMTEQRWADVLRASAPAVQRPAIAAALAEAWIDMLTARRAGRPFTVIDVAVRLTRALGLADPTRTLVRTLVDTAGVKALTLAPHLEICLSDLERRSIAIGIISDVGLTPSSQLRQELRRLGALQRFSYEAYSDETGLWKPSPELFRRAEEAVGARGPERCVHVGDSRAADVEGARRSGWWAVRYSGLLDDRASLPEADIVLSDLRGLGVALDELARRRSENRRLCL